MEGMREEHLGCGGRQGMVRRLRMLRRGGGRTCSLVGLLGFRKCWTGRGLWSCPRTGDCLGDRYKCLTRRLLEDGRCRGRSAIRSRRGLRNAIFAYGSRRGGTRGGMLGVKSCLTLPFGEKKSVEDQGSWFPCSLCARWEQTNEFCSFAIGFDVCLVI